MVRVLKGRIGLKRENTHTHAYTHTKKLTVEKQIHLSFNLGEIKKTKQTDIVPTGEEVIETQ